MSGCARSVRTINEVSKLTLLAAPDRYSGRVPAVGQGLNDDDVALRERLIEKFAGKLEDVELDVSWTEQRMIHQIHERATVLAEEHHDAGIRLTIRAPEPHPLGAARRAPQSRVVAVRRYGAGTR